MRPGEDIRALLNQVPAILYISDLGTEGAFQYVNRWIEPILGFTPEEWLGDPLLWVSQLHPDDRERVTADEDVAASTGESPSLSAEYRMLHKHGHTVWIRDEAVLLTDPDGHCRWYGVMSDVTERKQAELELARQAAAQEAVPQLGEHALERVSLPALFEEACASAARVLGADSAMVAEIGADRGVLLIHNSYGKPSDRLRETELFPDSQALYTISTGKPAQVDDWSTEVRFKLSPALRDRNVSASVCVRIEGTDKPFGVFSVLSAAPRVFSTADVHFIQSLANVLSDALERQRIEDAIEHRALHDPLTTLPNRVLFLDRLEHAIERVRRRRTMAAVLFIDLDHFKQINDRLGHQAGDELLASVANRLREAVRPTDTVARFGGDEFGLLLEEITNERDAIATAERIASNFARPFVLTGGSHFVTASIGIALTDGYEPPSELMRDADTAMYRAKERGRARYELFDENMRVRALIRLRMENDLRRALDRHELAVVYHPIVALHDERIVAVESILNWEHSERGWIAPREFVPVAEEAGLMDRIGRWALEEACRDAAAWARARPDEPPLLLWVNVSASELVNARFPDVVSELLHASGLEPDQLCLELRERVLAEDAEASRRALGRLKELGLKLSVDDFGGGQWSLAQAASAPIDAVKIDRSFIARFDTQEGRRLTSGVIALAKALELGVVACGVETAEQATALRGLGCGYAQGPLFLTAVSSREIANLQAEGEQLNRTTT